MLDFDEQQSSHTDNDKANETSFHREVFEIAGAGQQPALILIYSHIYIYIYIYIYTHTYTHTQDTNTQYTTQYTTGRAERTHP